MFVFLLLNSGYLAAYPAASLFYMGNVVAHLGAGLLLMAAAAWALKRYPREGGVFWRPVAWPCPSFSLATRSITAIFCGCTLRSESLRRR